MLAAPWGLREDEGWSWKSKWLLSAGTPLRPALPALLPAEPSVEEKLQKLHSEIKFALKVDNPVSSSQYRRSWLGPPSSDCWSLLRGLRTP